MKIRLTVVLVGVVAIFAACSSKQEATSNEPVDETPEASAPANAPKPIDDITQGKVLVEGSDCTTCHQAKIKIVGPSHFDVAVKYEFTDDNVKLLAGKIINGGSGVWGEIPMAPHPTITQGDAEKMARYVLSLDGEKPK